MSEVVSHELQYEAIRRYAPMLICKTYHHTEAKNKIHEFQYSMLDDKLLTSVRTDFTSVSSRPNICFILPTVIWARHKEMQPDSISSVCIQKMNIYKNTEHCSVDHYSIIL